MLFIPLSLAPKRKSILILAEIFSMKDIYVPESLSFRRFRARNFDAKDGVLGQLWKITEIFESDCHTSTASFAQELNITQLCGAT